MNNFVALNPLTKSVSTPRDRLLSTFSFHGQSLLSLGHAGGPSGDLGDQAAFAL